ncbi:hypothetical protein [Alicyclobacillus ferrooxydans]|uniref:Uncharacterized protein n=1 Tax=Alicyclobacillus ferrooxydans TaxID=471514 RepID=A0A0P9CJJ6_9BACL|nr:hypothetical protein [Alicyclobacillus ferrooxydans]KPV45492.1 hypothetical protein AN477_00580 [Alicyclobacillus ferrooxydans]
MSTTVPTNTVFAGHTSSFPSGPPGWNSPDPSAYAWTLPDTSHWYNVAQNISQGVFSFVANTLLELIAWILHIAIYVCSYFSDPSNITDKAVKATAGIFRNAYQDIFVKFLPVLIMFFVAYLAWKYVVAHHAKMIQGIASVLLATGLIAFFCFDFGPAFDTVDSFGQLVTNTAASAVASTAGTNVGSEYDTLWQNYVLFPWEYGQFGGFSGTYSDFNVSSAVCSDPSVSCSFTNDAGQKVSISGGNWVNLFLANTSSGARTSLENALTQAAQDGHSPFTGASLSAQDVTNANPYGMIPFLVIELLLILVPVFFLIYVGFQLFVRELLFIVTIMMGIVTIPMAFVPEIGWRITFNWLREAVGHQVERLGNAIYAALLFLVASLITQSVTHSEFGMMEAFLVDAILFAAALIYRQKVFSIAVNPLSDSVRGVDQHQRMTMDEYVAQQQEREQREGRHGSQGAGRSHKLGKLAEHFAASELHHEEHHVSAASTRQIGDALHVPKEDEQKPVGQSKQPHKFARHLANLGQAAKQRVEQHLQDAMSPGRPRTPEERIREREQRVRGIEAKLHGHSVKALRRTITSLPKLASGFNNPSDDDPPPSAPPGGGPVADSGDKLRKMMVTSDGSGSQGVIFDGDGNKIAYDPPSIARPRRDEAEINAPSLSEGFNVPQVQDVSSLTEQPSQPIGGALPEGVAEAEQAVQSTLATGFTPEPQSEPEPASNQAQLSAENPVSYKGENGESSRASTRPVKPLTPENGTVGQSPPQNAPAPHSVVVSHMSERPPTPTQTRPLPANVTRLQDEREHRQEVEGRQREQRSQRVRQAQGRRRAVRMNERSPRPPRP